MIDYNSFLFILAGLALIGGIVFGLFYNRIFTLAFKVKQNKNTVKNFHLKGGKEEIKEEDEEINQITKPNVIKKNFQLLEDEIKIYKFEKDLVSRAIENILDASKNKTIDPFEKDRLLLKYNDQLKKLNKNMEKLQSEIDITKLLDLRHDLVSLIENKISDIDEKINEINFNIKDKSNIAGINNQNKKNTATIKNKLKDPGSFYDIEEALDANLNSRKVINYKNNNINKKKETVTDAERKKIVNLKEQVLTALNRLDRAGIIKEEIENEIVVMEESKNKKNFMENEIKKPLQSVQNVYNFNNNEYANLNENRTSYAGISNKDKVSIPKIFNFISLSKNKNNTITSSQITSNPLLKSNNTNTQFTIKNDENTKKLKSENPLIKNHDQRNYNGNKSSSSSSSSSNISTSPLFNLLNNSNLKFEYSFNVNDYNKNKDKYKDKQSLDNKNTKKFKFSLGSIFSKRNKKEKEIEKKDYYDTNTKKRKDSLSNILDK